jgi:hypothetical protein
MQKNRIGIMVESLRLDIKQGIKKAKELGADGIQIYAVSGKMAPENLTSDDRKELLNYIKDNNLVVSALCGDLGGYGFTKRECNIQKIEKSKRIMDLARDLETKIVTTHIGVIPEEQGHERFKVLHTLKKLLDGGSIGRLVSVQHNENVAQWHQAHSFVRGNWRNSKESSPMILQKCCHDMDILRWLIGSECVNVSSFGALTYFKSENAPKGAPKRCLDGCLASKECPYFAPKTYLTSNSS